MITFKSIFCVCVVIHSLQQHQRLKFQSSVLLLHSFILLCYWEPEAWCECKGGNDEMLINMETVKGQDITLDKKPQRTSALVRVDWYIPKLHFQRFFWFSKYFNNIKYYQYVLYKSCNSIHPEVSMSIKQ